MHNKEVLKNRKLLKVIIFLKIHFFMFLSIAIKPKYVTNVSIVFVVFFAYFNICECSFERLF